MTRTHGTDSGFKRLRMQFLEYNARFAATFGMPLSRFWSHLTGFRYAAFDEIVTIRWYHRHPTIKEEHYENGTPMLPSGVSLQDAVQEIYGDVGVQVCLNILEQ